MIYDSDLDFDDASTLAYLCEEHKLRRIDLRAVTVTNDGFGRPGRTLRHAHSVLEQCVLPGVPLAEGAAGGGVHPAPPELVATIATVHSGALGDAALPPYPSRVSAAELIARTVRQSAAPVTILATGPLTNVAAALGRPGVARQGPADGWGTPGAGQPVRVSTARLRQLAGVHHVAGPEVTTFRPVRIGVVQNGVQSGRTVVTASGRLVRAAFEADAVAFERIFLQSLNGRR